MATFNMLPDGTTGTNQWTAGGTYSSHYAVNVDDSDTGYIYETTSGHEITFTMADPSVSESDIATINSVKIILKARYTNSSFSTRVLAYQGDGSSESAFDTHNIAAGSYATYNGAARSTAPDGGSWTYTDLENLQVRLDKILSTAMRTQVRVTYLYAEVDYDAAAGYTPNVSGTDNVAKVIGVSNIEKVIGV